FFFSSRRRHTRSYGDWSSDVCSSDLLSAGCYGRPSPVHPADRLQQVPGRVRRVARGAFVRSTATIGRISQHARLRTTATAEDACRTPGAVTPDSPRWNETTPAWHRHLAPGLGPTGGVTATGGI